jgi:hypothetical protein
VINDSYSHRQFGRIPHFGCREVFGAFDLVESESGKQYPALFGRGKFPEQQ